MNNILQNMKSGFANIKETLEIILSDDSNDNEGYEKYINSSNKDIAQIAQELKKSEEEQELKRLSIFDNMAKKIIKKKLKSETPSKNSSSQNTLSSDVHLLEDIEPDK